MNSLKELIVALSQLIYAAILKVINFVSESHEGHIEKYRDEFEETAMKLDQFKGVRFTRGEDGKYLNENLERAWVDFHEACFQRDNAW